MLRAIDTHDWVTPQTPHPTPHTPYLPLLRYRATYERNVAFLTMEGRAAAPSLMNVVMELRKCCNHPFLIEGAEAQILAQARDTSRIPISVT